MYSYLSEFLKYMVDDWERRVSLDSDNAGQMEAMWKSAFLLAKPLFQWKPLFSFISLCLAAN